MEASVPVAAHNDMCSQVWCILHRSYCILLMISSPSNSEQSQMYSPGTCIILKHMVTRGFVVHISRLEDLKSHWVTMLEL